MFLVMLSVGAVSAVDDVNSTDNVFVDGTNDISCDLQNEYDDVEQVSNDYVIVNSSNYLDYFDEENGTLMEMLICVLWVISAILGLVLL